MTTAIKRRRGTTAEHSTFVGLEGEITIDSTKDTVVVHDGATVGGFPLAKENNATLTNMLTIDAAIKPILRLAGDGNNADNTVYGEIQFYNKDLSRAAPNTAASIRALSGGLFGNGGQLSFSTTPYEETTEGAAPIQRFFIDDNGNSFFYSKSGTYPSFYWDSDDTIVFISASGVSGDGGDNATLQIGAQETSQVTFASSTGKSLKIQLNETAGIGLQHAKITHSDGLSIFSGTSTNNAIFYSTGNVSLSNGALTADYATGNVTISGNLAVSSGTANGVTYLNGSKVLTTGSALTFDGTNLGVGTDSPAAKLDITSASGGYSNIKLVQTGVRTWAIENTGTSGLFKIIEAGVSDRLVIDGSGNLGIGTSLPTAKLHINNSTGSAVTLLKMQTGWDNPSGNKSMVWSDNTGDLGRISVSYSAPQAKMTFGSLYNSGYQSSDLMTLTADGNVGIGENSPAQKLSLVGTSTFSGFGSGPQITMADTLGRTLALVAPGSVVDAYVGTTTNHTLNFMTGGTGRAVIDTSGNFGIGTSSLVSRLTVKASGGTYATGSLALVGSSSGTTYLTNAGGTFYISNDGSTDHLVMSSTGNVGIGTSDPGFKLGISGVATTYAASASVALYDTVSGVAASRNWLIGNVAAGNYGELNFAVSSAAGGAPTNSKMTLDSSGNLGLGVTPSAWLPLGAGGPILQIQNAAFFGSASTTGVLNNAYYNGGFKYISSDYASWYEQIDSKHVWHTAPSWNGTGSNAIAFNQAMTLDASGRLLVGVTSTSYSNKLVVGASENYRGIELSTVTAAARPTLTLVNYNTNTYGSYIQDSSAGDLIFGRVNADYGGHTERARISANGRFEVSYSTNNGSQAALFTNSAATAGNQYGLGITLASDPNSTGTYFLQCLGNATERLTIRSNGGIANYSANDANLSDRREKTNFAPAKSYLDVICAIPVQTFNYIDQNLEEDGGLTLGVVAQDVQAVAPELVMESNWGTEEDPKMRLSIYQTDLQYALMKCIQEQQAIIESLKARLDAANL